MCCFYKKLCVVNLKGGVMNKGTMVLCKTCEIVNGELKCVVFFFYMLSI
jgi:hypothetical protein